MSFSHFLRQVEMRADSNFKKKRQRKRKIFFFGSVITPGLHGQWTKTASIFRIFSPRAWHYTIRRVQKKIATFSVVETLFFSKCLKMYYNAREWPNVMIDTYQLFIDPRFFSLKASLKFFRAHIIKNFHQSTDSAKNSRIFKIRWEPLFF